MTFPVLIPIGSWRLPAHLVFEVLAYATGFQLYLWLRRRRGDAVGNTARWWIVGAAVTGAALGSRLLSLAGPSGFPRNWRDPAFWIGGKTIVGGLIGGTLAVEGAKHCLKVKTRTGDLFSIPLALGIAIGRIGCFLTGLADGTYGNPTTLWTGVDFGDGIPRHPTQLYEIGFLLLLIPVLKKVGDTAMRAGNEFRVFMIAYLTFRLLVDGLKPDPAVALGLSPIQWACASMLAFYAIDLGRPGHHWGALGPSPPDAADLTTRS